MLAANKQDYSRMDARNSLADFSRDLLLRDGAILRFRALRPGDRDALKALFSRCSPASIRYRFLQSIKALPEKTFDQLARVEGSRVVEAAPRIAEVDLNPVMVHQEGAGVSLIDARVRLSVATGENPWSVCVTACLPDQPAIAGSPQAGMPALPGIF
jgi:hypothetical protein